MLGFVMVSMLVAASDPLPAPAASLEGQPTRYCRELGSAASRNQAIFICRTKVQWLKAEACTGPTRYCTPRQKLALRDTPYPLDEDSRILCRKVSATGSRLSKVDLCLPKRDWQRMFENGNEAAADMLRKRTGLGADWPK